MLRRNYVNKKKSAGMFKRNVRRTKAPNMRMNPMSGGLRL